MNDEQLSLLHLYFHRLQIPEERMLGDNDEEDEDDGEYEDFSQVCKTNILKLNTKIFLCCQLV